MNSFGSIYNTSIFGESHGKHIGVVIDGCPPGIHLKEEDFIEDLSRRKAGAKGTTPRKEADLSKIVSGVFNGMTTGTPITILFENTNTKSQDYEKIKATPRPGHADFVAEKKFLGFQDYRGGGHFSGRLTLGLVSSGIIAKKIINPIQTQAKLIEAGGEKDIEKAIEKAIANKDSIGGIVECTATHMPIGLGEPFFNSIESLISHIIFSIPAIKGIEFGSGFAATKMFGSENNDSIVNKKGQTKTNHAGGINGGLTNGNNLILRVGVKPTSSTPKPQKTWNQKTDTIESFIVHGRHDLCIALRAPVVVESAVAMVLADLLLQNKKWQ